MKTFIISIKLTLAFCLLLGVGYVLVLWGVAQVATPNSGAVVPLLSGQRVVGVEGVGQAFTSTTYFWSRPSAVAYNGSGSGGSNKGVTNPDYLTEVATRIDLFLLAHPYLQRSQVPSELVTASASGLDPHISIVAAQVQAQRVAEAREVELESVKQLINETAERPMVGPAMINVLKLNIALDENFKK